MAKKKPLVEASPNPPWPWPDTDPQSISMLVTKIQEQESRIEKLEANVLFLYEKLDASCNDSTFDPRWMK